jgi:hypothetical protein
MIFDPKIFYDKYLTNYHWNKALYIKKILDDVSKYEVDFFGRTLSETDRDEIQKTLKADLRQTYFHAIETVFELFFALNPQNHTELDDRFVLFRMTNANWTQNYRTIQKIAKEADYLEFLSDEIDFMGNKISIGHYLFYMGIFSKEKFPEEVFSQIDESIEAVKYGLRILAQDFSGKDEYNAYKHGLRIIPATSKLMAADAKTMEVKVEWDISEGMSYYLKTKKADELTVVTQLFDPERDFQMISFCSNLIEHMIKYRKIVFDPDKEKKANQQVAIKFFAKEPIDDCRKVNVNIQNLVYTVSKA